MERQSPKFDLSWKSTCLDILNLYRQKKLTLGIKKKVGWSVVRDEIMFLYDEINGKKIVQRDERLVRQDLEAWSKTGSSGQNISDVKFRFIDDFVLDILLSGQHRDIEDFAVRQRAEAHCRAVAAMHQNHKFDKSTAEYLAKRLGRFLLSDDLGKRIEEIPFRHVAIRLDFTEDGAIKVTLAYLPAHPLTASSADIENAIFCDGYLVPLRIPYDAVMANLSSSRSFGNPLAFEGDLAFTKPSTVRVECALIILGQTGVGSARGRASGEAIAFIDISSKGGEGAHLKIGLPFSIIGPSEIVEAVNDDQDGKESIVWNLPFKYQELLKNYIILSDKVMNIDFSVKNEYKSALEAVFGSGHRGLLI